MRTATLLTALMAVLSGASRADAGLFDWLFPPRVPATVSTYYPPQVVATQTNQLVVSYRPQVRYRTSWARVPVTVYRPVTNVTDTGCTVSCMRPCTTYEWQRRRVPVTTYRPSYRVVRQPCAVVQQPVVSSGCSGCGVDPGFPSTTTTTTTPNDYYEYPSGVGGSRSSEPADTRPSVRGTPPPAESGQGSSILQRSRPAYSFRRKAAPPLAPIIRRNATQTPARNPVTVRSGPAPQQPVSAEQRQQLKPIPDPERHNRRVTPPALIKPAGRTVRNEVRDWQSAPIEWAAPIKVRPASAVAAPAPQATKEIDYDDGGWTSLAR